MNYQMAVKGKMALTMLLPAVAIIGLAYFSDISQVAEIAKELTFPVFSMIVIISVLRPIIGGARSSYAYSPIAELRIRDAAKGYSLSAFGGIFLPSSIGGDVLRIEHMKNSTNSTRKEAFLVAAVERISGLLSLILMTVCVSFLDLPFSISFNWIYVMLFAGILFIILTLFIVKKMQTNSVIVKTVDYIQNYASPKLLAGVFFLTVIFQCVSLSIPALVAWSISGYETGCIVAVITPIVALVASLPISVGGIGIREAGYVGFGTLLGVDSDILLISGLSLSASIILSGLPGIWLQKELISTTVDAESK
jgi:hypothetical protein